MQFHAHFAPATGWMNDPNGLIDVDGVHHLFFQHDPDSTREGPAGGKITWGHAISTDFVHWQELPTALNPGDAGDYDDRGCFSGCAVRREDGRVVAVYSGHTAHGDLPCVAFADDAGLVHWTKSQGNPVISRRPPIEGITDFRDHSVRKRGDVWEQWVAVGGARGGMIVGYTSMDLEHWTYSGVLLSARAADLPDGIWECPDVFEIGDTTVVIVSWLGAMERGTIWVTGTRDASGFVPERWGELDRGALAYAPQSYTAEDNRRILFAWLVTVKDRAAHGRENMGVQSLPRLLGVRDARLTQEPVAEITARGVVARETVAREGTIDVDSLEAFEVTVHGEDLAATARLVLTGARGRTADVPVRLLREVAYHEREKGVWVARTSPVGALRVVFDRGIIEIFADDGRAVAVCDLALDSVSRIGVRRLGEAGGSLDVTVSALRVE